MSMHRGFTFIEVMVVVSIMSMLTSVVLASVTPARAKARDSQRIQQVRQIDLAVQLYKASHNGNAPDLQSSCQAQIQAMEITSAVSGCVAVSSQGTAVGTPWQRLQADLQPYIATLPADPCGSTCSVIYGSDLGYTYYSPAYFQSACGSACNYSNSIYNQSYQLVAQLEQQNTQAQGSGTSVKPVISISMAPSSGPDGPSDLSWSATNATSCMFMVDASKDYNFDAWEGYAGFVGPAAVSGSYHFTQTVPAVFIFTCTGPGGSATRVYNFIGY